MTVHDWDEREGRKGGMTDDEFKKYINSSIVSFYPDLEDTQENASC